jgi:hypothetical protein
MNEKVESNRAVLQQATRDAQESSLGHLKQVVANREKAFEALARLDPDSKPAQDARARLDKARSDYDSFAASVGERGPEIPTSDSEPTSQTN